MCYLPGDGVNNKTCLSNTWNFVEQENNQKFGLLPFVLIVFYQELTGQSITGKFQLKLKTLTFNFKKLKNISGYEADKTKPNNERSIKMLWKVTNYKLLCELN